MESCNGEVSHITDGLICGHLNVKTHFVHKFTFHFMNSIYFHSTAVLIFEISVDKLLHNSILSKNTIHTKLSQFLVIYSH
jgi:hypothetical protein